MSIEASVLNYILRKYVKSIKKSPEESSYKDARRLMNQKGYEDKNQNIVSKILLKKIFRKKKSSIKVEELYLNQVRTLKFDFDKSDKKKCILYFHGGGYVAGSPETHQNFLISLCKKSEIDIYAIDYALAPENPFPAAINDAVESLEVLIEIGYESKNIIIGGDSAGGNLALVSILKLQELKKLLPSKVFLLSPWTDLTASGDSIKYNSKKDPYLSYDDFLSTQKSMIQAAKDWYAPNQNHKNQMISPVFGHYESFPNTLIQVSDIEILFSDSINLAKKLKQNNNKVKLSIYKNLPHVWQIFGFLPEAKKAVNEIAFFLNQQ